MKFCCTIIERLSANRNHALSPTQQVLICLRFYAYGNMLVTVGDFSGVHKSTVCGVIKRVTRSICILREMFINIPNNENERVLVQHGFYNIARFPRVLYPIFYFQ